MLSGPAQEPINRGVAPEPGEAVGKVGDLAGYATCDRAEIIDDAGSRGRYARLRDVLVIEDPSNPVATIPGQRGGRHKVKLSQLAHADRQISFLDDGCGLEPAALWLGENGMQLARSTWQKIFADLLAGRAGRRVGGLLQIIEEYEGNNGTQTGCVNRTNSASTASFRHRQSGRISHHSRLCPSQTSGKVGDRAQRSVMRA